MEVKANKLLSKVKVTLGNNLLYSSVNSYENENSHKSSVR